MIFPKMKLKPFYVSLLLLLLSLTSPMALSASTISDDVLTPALAWTANLDQDQVADSSHSVDQASVGQDSAGQDSAAVDQA